jgi:hypothetical protein
MVSPPSVTLSVPTVPEAEEESPYEIFHEEPELALNVLDLLESKITCPEDFPWLWIEELSSVDQTYNFD